MGTTNVPYSRYTLHDYIATSADDIYADRQVRLVVETAGGESVGLADIIHYDPRHQRAEVGIVILDGARRQGYATAALSELAVYAGSILHMHQLYGIVAADNTAALSLFRKAGYQQQATLKDWLFDGHIYQDAVVMQTFL